jgi:hypothetical protein
MARNIWGNKVIRKEDRYTSKSKFTQSDIRWEQFKIVIWLVLGYAYFHFIAMGWTW